MNTRRDALILLGWVGLGMTIDVWIGPIAYLALWFVARHRRTSPAHPAADALALILGSLIGGWTSKQLGGSGQFFLGHGLAIVQCVRMGRPLSRRDDGAMLMISLLHLGVVCTTILDIRFFAIFIAMVVLVPRALSEWAAGGGASNSPSSPPGPTLSWMQYCLIGMVSVAVFVLFPRVALGGSWRGAGRGAGQGMVDNSLDPSRGGLENSRRILMQVEAASLGYLRTVAFTDFDGQIWKKQNEGGLTPILASKKSETPERRVKRRARVKQVHSLNASQLGRVLPTDGRVVRLEGPWFLKAFRNTHGIIEVQAGTQRSNATYEWWTDLSPKPEPLTKTMRERCLKAPPASDRLRQWMAERLGGETDPIRIARLLEAHFRDRFEYELGAPQLNRANVLEAFIFEQRKGHCERFASALALLLRMQGIPTRVMGGFAPGERNWISGWYDIRFSDAHAWTEAWFESTGWITLDATPRALRPPPGSGLSDLFEALDFAWYAQVVNLDTATQSELFATATSFAAKAASSLAGKTPHMLLGLGLLALLRLAWVRRRHPPSASQPPATVAERHAIELRHFYDEMLAAMRHRQLNRSNGQTPHEFLKMVSASGCPCQIEVERVTDLFCKSRYGSIALTEEDLDHSRRAMKKIQEWSRGNGQNKPSKASLQVRS